MKIEKFFGVLAVCLAVSGSSFGAEHVVTRSAKAAGKDTYKVGKYSAKGTGKAVKGTGKALKFIF